MPLWQTKHVLTASAGKLEVSKLLFMFHLGRDLESEPHQFVQTLISLIVVKSVMWSNYGQFIANDLYFSTCVSEVSWW